MQVKVIGDRTATPSFDMRDSLGDLEKAQVENRNALKNQPQKLHLRSPTILLGFRSNMFGQGPRPNQDLSRDVRAVTCLMYVLYIERDLRDLFKM